MTAIRKWTACIVSLVIVMSLFTGCGASKKAPDVSQVEFADKTVTYDGTEHSVTASQLPDGVTVQYDNNVQSDAGTYTAKADLYYNASLLTSLTATLTVQKRAATVTVDDVLVRYGQTPDDYSYTVDGVLEGDDLGVTLTPKAPASVGIGSIEGTYTNTNYDVTFVGGKYTVLAPDTSATVFADVTATYDGTAHAITATGLPDGATVVYENNEHAHAGTYTAKAKIYCGKSLVKTLTATLTVNKKLASVTVQENQTVLLGQTDKLQYTVDGVLEGDDLGVTLSVKGVSSGLQKQIVGSYTNTDYEVTFSQTTCTVLQNFTRMDGLTADADFITTYAPYALQSNLFADTVITQISFYFGKFVDGSYNANSSNLQFPVYVIKSDFSSKQADCTEANGKKIVLDFTGKLDGVKAGDLLTATDLHIEVGADETLAFGDADMTIMPQYKKGNTKYGFWGGVFNATRNNFGTNSLMFDIVGYSKRESTYISFLGDSISTYTGYSNGTAYNATIGGNAVWFPNNNYAGADMAVTETWWHRAMTTLEYKLCVNNSWSGSVVKDAQTYNVRAKNLHNTAGQTPDIVIIFMGVNDFAAGTAVGSYNGTTAAPATPTDFSGAYVKTIATIRDTYPNTSIYCCTFLPDRKRTANSVYNGVNETAFNNAIRTIAANMDCTLIDLYNDSGITTSNVAAYTVDRLHPNSTGMRMIAETVVNVVAGIPLQTQLASAA